MGIILDLYRGDLQPADRIGTVPGEFRDARDQLYRFCEAMEGRLPEELRPDLDHLMDLAGDSITTVAEAGFVDGFKAAMNIMIEALQ